MFLRLWPIEHGMPENYLPDTHVVKNALGMARDKHPVPPSGLYSTYPYLLSYMLLPVYAGEYGLGRVTGEWSGSGEFKQRVLEEPALVHLPARILLALLCALTPLVIYRGARAAGMRGGAWVAAWLVATGLLHLHFSVQERPWGPLVFFMALTALFVVRHAKSGAFKDLALAGVAAGLAFATHQAGVLALGMCGLGWLISAGGWKGKQLSRRLQVGVLCVGVAVLIGLLVGHPYYLLHGGPETASFTDASDVDMAIGGQGIVFELRFESLKRLTMAMIGYDPAIVILSLFGLAAALARRETRAVTIFVLAWLAFFTTNQNDHIRYLLPAAVLLVYPAGMAADMLLQKRWGIAVLIPLCLFPAVQALRLAWVLRQPDSRELALEAIEQLPEGARIAVDRYGPNIPMDRASLERLAKWRELGSREQHRLSYFEADLVPFSGIGRDSLRLEDLYQFSDRFESYQLKEVIAADLAQEFGEQAAALALTSTASCFELLGITHVLLVDRRPLDGLPPAVIYGGPALDGSTNPRPLVLGDQFVQVIDPSNDASPARETLLPTDMDFPLTAIWQVERPGPYMRICEVAR
ncbi:MAG: hypothetical protein ACI8TQ_000919 [Planctomycetota bacterium]